MHCFDLEDGAGDDLTKFFPDKKWDCFAGSQVLEHALDPVVMLRSWIACLKPKGYIVATVPDWTRYEKEIWPSQWNAGHRSIWSLDANSIFNAIRDYPEAICILLPDWLNQFLNTDKPCEILLCRLIDTSDHSLPDNVDQTLPADGAEVFIEMVLRRI